MVSLARLMELWGVSADTILQAAQEVGVEFVERNGELYTKWPTRLLRCEWLKKEREGAFFISIKRRIHNIKSAAYREHLERSYQWSDGIKGSFDAED